MYGVATADDLWHRAMDPERRKPGHDVCYGVSAPRDMVAHMPLVGCRLPRLAVTSQRIVLRAVDSLSRCQWAVLLCVCWGVATFGYIHGGTAQWSVHRHCSASAAKTSHELSLNVSGLGGTRHNTLSILP